MDRLPHAFGSVRAGKALPARLAKRILCFWRDLVICRADILFVFPHGAQMLGSSGLRKIPRVLFAVDEPAQVYFKVSFRMRGI